jgi:hypothetical protein
MECDFLNLVPSSQSIDLIPCALRLKAPDELDRIPTHFILLLDVSESMNDDNKLENIKQCAKILLSLMCDSDSISLITFGDSASCHLKRIQASESNKGHIQSILESLHCQGCTNLSAGLGLVHDVCQNETLKTGLLVLTDGHANRGVHNPAELRRMFNTLKTSCLNLSIHSVGYGLDHNAELLREIAEDCQGSYNIVNTIEDAATAFGDTLGGLLSCAFQNVEIHVPLDVVVQGNHKITQKGDKQIILIGDVYAGTKPVLLLDFLTTTLNSPNPVIIKGMNMPSMSLFQYTPQLSVAEGRQVDLELTYLRQVCTGLLKDIRNWSSAPSYVREGLSARIDKFRTDIHTSFFDGNPVADLLRNEIRTIQQTFEEIQLGNAEPETNAVLSQHIASIGLARGFSSPAVRLRRARPVLYGEEAFPISQDSMTDEEELDPTELHTTSAFQNSTQTRITNAMRSVRRS